MSILAAKIESLLFIATKPMSTKQLANVCVAQILEIEEGVAELMKEKNVEGSGIHVVVGEEGVMLVTNPAFADIIAGLSKEDVESELTRPSLETLTIIAYRGPITKPEIETIRGVNCSLILRNLMMRGLVDEQEDVVKMQPVYSLTNDAMRYLGIHTLDELPDYAELHGNAKIDSLLAALSLGSDV